MDKAEAINPAGQRANSVATMIAGKIMANTADPGAIRLTKTRAPSADTAQSSAKPICVAQRGIAGASRSGRSSSARRVIMGIGTDTAQ